MSKLRIGSFSVASFLVLILCAVSSFAQAGGTTVRGTVSDPNGNLVKGATGQTIDAETLGGAKTHTEVSAVAHYRAANDPECLERIRQYIARLPRHEAISHRTQSVRPPARPTTDLYDILPQDHRLSYDMRHVLACLLDGIDWRNPQYSWRPASAG